MQIKIGKWKKNEGTFSVGNNKGEVRKERETVVYVFRVA